MPADDFLLLSRLVSGLHHVGFHERARRVTDAWDVATTGDELGGGDEAAVGAAAEGAATVEAEMRSLLEAANYVEVSPAELHDAMLQESALPVRLEVDLDAYDVVTVHRRGTRQATLEVPRWRGLSTQRRTITVDERVVVHTRVKPAPWFAERGIDPQERGLVPGHVALKLFRDIPRADVEMLLPSAKVRMRPVDSLLVGVPAVASGIAVLVTKLLPTIGLMFVLVGAWLGLRDEEPRLDQGAMVVLVGGMITLGGFLVRQWSKLKNRRLRYLKTLSESLYFRTVASGPGVLHALLDAAEQQETAEVLLAYWFLAGEDGPVTPEELDTAVQAWLRTAYHAEVDFEVDDALAKLRDLDLVVPTEGAGGAEGAAAPPRVAALPLPDALDALDRRWDAMFGRASARLR